MNNTVIKSLAADYQKEHWAMESRSLESFIGHLCIDGSSCIEPQTEIVKEKTILTNNIQGEVTIKISGTLLKTVPPILKYWGFDVTGYDDIVAQIDKAIAEPKVKSIKLLIDSPGGMVSGSMEAAQAIAGAAKIKRVNAAIENLGASGAYLLASQANRIGATVNAEVGSIGVYAVYYDYSKMAESAGAKVRVIKSGEHKGMGVVGAEITEEQIAAVQDVIDGMADNFMKAVANGRSMDIKDVREVATGRTWLADKAKKLNLIDNVINKVVLIKTNKSQGVNSMTNTNIEIITEVDAVKVKADAHKEGVAQGVQSERDRFKALNEAFPNDLKFASEQYIAGANIEQAKIAFADILAKRLSEETAKNVELEKKLKDKESVAVEGVKPIAHNEAAATKSSDVKEFIAAARERAASKNISLEQSMRELKREQDSEK